MSYFLNLSQYSGNLFGNSFGLRRTDSVSSVSSVASRRQQILQRINSTGSTASTRSSASTGTKSTVATFSHLPPESSIIDPIITPDTDRISQELTATVISEIRPYFTQQIIFPSAEPLLSDDRTRVNERKMRIEIILKFFETNKDTITGLHKVTRTRGQLTKRISLLYEMIIALGTQLAPHYTVPIKSIKERDIMFLYSVFFQTPYIKDGIAHMGIYEALTHELSRLTGAPIDSSPPIKQAMSFITDYVPLRDAGTIDMDTRTIFYPDPILLTMSGNVPNTRATYLELHQLLLNLHESIEYSVPYPDPGDPNVESFVNHDDLINLEQKGLIKRILVQYDDGTGSGTYIRLPEQDSIEISIPNLGDYLCLVPSIKDSIRIFEENLKTDFEEGLQPQDVYKSKKRSRDTLAGEHLIDYPISMIVTSKIPHATYALIHNNILYTLGYGYFGPNHTEGSIYTIDYLVQSLYDYFLVELSIPSLDVLEFIETSFLKTVKKITVLNANEGYTNCNLTYGDTGYKYHETLPSDSDDISVISNIRLNCAKFVKMLSTYSSMGIINATEFAQSFKTYLPVDVRFPTQKDFFANSASLLNIKLFLEKTLNQEDVKKIINMKDQTRYKENGLTLDISVGTNGKLDELVVSIEPQNARLQSTYLQRTLEYAATAGVAFSDAFDRSAKRVRSYLKVGGSKKKTKIKKTNKNKKKTNMKRKTIYKRVNKKRYTQKTHNKTKKMKRK